MVDVNAQLRSMPHEIMRYVTNMFGVVSDGGIVFVTQLVCRFFYML